MAKALQRLERPQALYRTVQLSIKDYILENNLQAGNPLPPETELARQLGVSRNSVREAAKALESLGILETRHGSGLFVSDFSFEPLLENLPYGLLFDLQELANLWEVRHVLEIGMIEPALRSISDEQVSRMFELTEKMRARAEQGQKFLKEDREFHRTLFMHLDNSILLKIMDIFWVTLRKALDFADIQHPDPMHVYTNHLAFYEAVKARDVEQARAAINRHDADLKSRLDQVQMEKNTHARTA